MNRFHYINTIINMNLEDSQMRFIDGVFTVTSNRLPFSRKVQYLPAIPDTRITEFPPIVYTESRSFYIIYLNSLSFTNYIGNSGNPFMTDQIFWSLGIRCVGFQPYMYLDFTKSFL